MTYATDEDHPVIETVAEPYRNFVPARVQPKTVTWKQLGLALDRKSVV